MKLYDLIFATVAIVTMLVVYRLTNSELAAGMIGAFAAVWGVALQFRLTRQKEVDARLFTQKAEAYEDLINLISEMFQQQKNIGQEPDLGAASVRFVKIRTNLIIWGSAETIKALDDLGDPLVNPSTQQILERLARLYAAVRRDLGHNEGFNAAKNIATGHLVPEDRAKVR